MKMIEIAYYKKIGVRERKRHDVGKTRSDASAVEATRQVEGGGPSPSKLTLFFFFFLFNFFFKMLRFLKMGRLRVCHMGTSNH